MPTSEQLAKRIWDIFTLPTPPLRKAFRDNPQLPPLTSLPPGAEAIKDFSPFLLPHLDRAGLVKEEMDRKIAAGPTEEDGMNAALDLFESLVGKENPDLLFYALELFLVHYKGSVRFTIPSLLVREPELVTPSDVPGHVKMAIAIGSTDETKLDRFRESPALNEHHLHWHTVYNGNRIIDRQGEMFFYMHQQMIARYDAERLSEDVARVKPFNDFSKFIEVGYGAGPDERLSDFIAGSRQPRVKVSTTNAQQQRSFLVDITQDINSGVYDPAGAGMSDETKALNRLGSTIEPNRNPDADNTASYFGYHGFGHMAISGLNSGVMKSTVTAVRDVVFWEWHKGIDNLYFNLQERLSPYNLIADAPPVLLRKSVDDDNEPYSSDIILVSGNNLPDATAGSLAFGGAHWDDDFENGNFNYTDTNGTNRTIATTNVLKTSIKQGTIRYRSLSTGQWVQYPYSYLVHDSFSYFIRIENTSLQQKQVTVRIFMVPTSETEDRRMWIEMDKFLQELPPQSKTVVYRKDTESSVVKKPVKPDPAGPVQFDPTDIDMENGCDCGWPYQMLLPKGKSQGDGMAHRLMVMISDAAVDMMQKEDDCGSLSFCAARTTGYPDKRPLGYPFNRPFTGGANKIMDTIRSRDNMACRTVYIKHQ